MRRTVKVLFNPRPRLPITTPEKIWMRSLSPSTTLVWTRTESPTLNLAGSLRNCSDSILSNSAWLIKSLYLFLRFGQQVWPALRGAQPGLFGAPFFYLCVMAGEEDFRDFHPAKLRWPRVMRILQQT